MSAQPYDRQVWDPDEIEKVEGVCAGLPSPSRFSTPGEFPDSESEVDTPAARRALLVREVQALTQLIDAHGYMVRGSAGQLVLNPAVAARRAAMESIRKLDLAAPPEPLPDERDDFLDGPAA